MLQIEHPIRHNAAPRDIEKPTHDHDIPMMYRFVEESNCHPHRINPIIIVLFADQVESISQSIDPPCLWFLFTF